MNNTISELYNKLILLEINTKLFPNKYIPFDNINIINCVKNTCQTCNRYDKIIYKGNELHICYDDWSFNYGWHVIVPETLELCMNEVNCD